MHGCILDKQLDTGITIHTKLTIVILNENGDKGGSKNPGVNVNQLEAHIELLCVFREVVIYYLDVKANLAVYATHGEGHQFLNANIVKNACFRTMYEYAQ
jgi:hypothetical protein